MPTSAYFRDLILGRTLLALPGLYVSLHTADPAENGTGEITDYERQPLSLRRIDIGVAINAAAIEFDNLPSTKITHYAIWDARSGGNYLMSGELLNPITIQDGQALRWQAAELIMRF